jgi:hypothetical protein
MTAAERLVKYYKDAYKRLLKKISELPPGSGWQRYYRRLVREIEKEVAKLDGEAAKQLAELVKKTYSAAEAKALSDIQAGPFGGLNRSAMRLIAENAVDQMVEANHYFGRHLADAIRQIGLDAIAEKLSAGQTVREARKRLIERLQSDGMTTVSGGAGRKYRLESYAELVARTTTREATNTATTSTGEQLGYDLVKFSTHYPTCEVCAPIQGRVFSISGKDTRFPALSEVPGFDKGFKTIHPNCRHVLVLTVEALWTDAEREKYLADAGKPLRGDTRTQQEVDAYNATQAEKRDRWQDRRQWEKYRAALGDDAPKTFSAFRAVKRADGESWAELQGTYKDVSWQLKCQKNLTVTQDHKLPTTDQPPNSAIDRINQYDKIIRRRYFNAYGNVKLDFDTTDHGAPKDHPYIPHSHDWTDSSTGTPKHWDNRKSSRAEIIANMDIIGDQYGYE